MNNLGNGIREKEGEGTMSGGEFAFARNSASLWNFGCGGHLSRQAVSAFGESLTISRRLAEQDADNVESIKRSVWVPDTQDIMQIAQSASASAHLLLQAPAQAA
jgi:hypothetical protein